MTVVLTAFHAPVDKPMISFRIIGFCFKLKNIFYVHVFQIIIFLFKVVYLK